MMDEIDILYEDAHIIVCVKPPGVPSQSDRSMDFDMVRRLKNYLSEKGEKPDIMVVHRLDRPVGGVMVYAKTKKAAANLSRDISGHQFVKQYVAVVTPKEGVGVIEKGHKNRLENYLMKDGRSNLSKIVDKNMNNAKKAVLTYEVRDVSDKGLALVTVDLETGRHHQIRVQLSGEGLPIYGDTKYNYSPDNKGWSKIALFAYRLKFIHPVTNREMDYCVIPKNFPVPYNREALLHML